MENTNTITFGSWLKNSLIGYSSSIFYCGLAITLLNGVLGGFSFHLVLIVGLTVGWYQLKALREVHQNLNSAWAWTYPLGFTVAYLFSLFFNEFTEGEFPQDILHTIRVILGTCIFGFFQARILAELLYKNTYVYFVTTVMTSVVISFFSIFYFDVLKPYIFDGSELFLFILLAFYAVFASCMSALAMQYIQKQTLDDTGEQNSVID